MDGSPQIQLASAIENKLALVSGGDAVRTSGRSPRASLQTQRLLADLRRLFAAARDRDNAHDVLRWIDRALDLLGVPPAACLEAWHCAHQADMALLSLLEPDELNSRLLDLEAESQVKLSGWRAEAAQHARQRLGTDTPATPASRRSVAVQLRGHLAEAALNARVKQQLITAHVRRATGFLGVLIATFDLAVGWGALACLDTPCCPGLTASLLIGEATGALGGLLYALSPDDALSRQRSIPDTEGDLALLWFRPVTGAATALPIVLLLASRMEILAQPYLVSLVLLTTMAGYSQRWFARWLDQQSPGR